VAARHTRRVVAASASGRCSMFRRTGASHLTCRRGDGGVNIIPLGLLWDTSHMRAASCPRSSCTPPTLGSAEPAVAGVEPFSIGCSVEIATVALDDRLQRLRSNPNRSCSLDAHAGDGATARSLDLLANVSTRRRRS
jgi:hypothetical protein